MKLYYFDNIPNFGDSLNQWLWERLLPGVWDSDAQTRFSGIGTILNANMPPAKKWIVFSSGVGYGRPPHGFGDARWSIVCVRGPLTAAALGLPRQSALCDGAILLAALEEYAPLPESERDGIVFVAHHGREAAVQWPEICRRAGIEYLSPAGESRKVIQRLRRAKLVIAEAMHAAIIADAVRVPWIPVMSSLQISAFKWLDWTRSLDLQYSPRRLPASSASATLFDLTLWAYGGSYYFEGRSESEALDHFEQKNRSAPGRAYSRVMWFGRRAHRRVDRALKSSTLAPLLGRSERRLDMAAAALRDVAREPAFLSNERVFADRLDGMLHRLEDVRSMTGAAPPNFEASFAERKVSA